MTRALAIISALLLIAAIVLGLLLAQARDDAAVSDARHAAQIEIQAAALAAARAQIAGAEAREAQALKALEAAEARLADAQVAAQARVLVEHEREVQTLSEAPNADGARASLEAAGVTSTETSTLSLTWAAMARWRRVASEAQVQAEVMAVELDLAAARADAAGATAGLAQARAQEQIAGLGLELAEARAQLGARVSRTRRAVSAVSVGALVGGVAAAGLGLALCPDARCREVLGLGGAGLAVAGGAGAVLSW